MKKFVIAIIALTSSMSVIAQTGNVGIGTASPGSKLTVNGSLAAPYKIVTASATVGANDFYLAYNGTSTGTLTLPAATSAAPANGNTLGRMYHFKNTGTAILTVAAAAGEAIDNQSGTAITSFTLSPGYYAMIVSKGAATGTTWELALIANASMADPSVDAFINNAGNTRVELGTKSDNLTARTAGTEFVIKDNGYTGIGITNPANNLDINGTTRIRLTNPPATNTLNRIYPLYVDTAGVVIKRITRPDFAEYINSTGVAPGGTETINFPPYSSTLGNPLGFYKITITCENPCAGAAITEFIGSTFYENNDGSSSGSTASRLTGVDGFNNTASTASGFHPTFTQTDMKTVAVIWPANASTACGGSSNFNFTLKITNPTSGSTALTITNNTSNSNALKYRISLKAIY